MLKMFSRLFARMSHIHGEGGPWSLLDGTIKSSRSRERWMSLQSRHQHNNQVLSPKLQGVGLNARESPFIPRKVGWGMATRTKFGPGGWWEK